MSIPENWTFKTAGVAEGFDRHVREQLPWYDMATHGVAHIVRHYLPEGGLMYDVGASTGNIGRACADTLRVRGARLVPVEASPDMAALYEGPGRESLICDDACAVTFDPCDVIVAFLVLMFVPLPKRAALVERMCRSVNPGGCVIVFDKVESAGGYPGVVMHRLTLAGKVASGVPAEEIVAKELSLAGVQRPIREAMLAESSMIHRWLPWFRFGEFAGWMCER